MKPLFAFKSILIAWVGLGIAGFAAAAAPFNENFDTYTAEQNLSGQGSWICSSSSLIKNDVYQTSPNSVLAPQGCYRNNGNSTSDGELYFYVKTDNHSSGWAEFSLTGNGQNCGTRPYTLVAWSTANGTLTEAYTGTTNWGTLQAGWNVIGIKWHYDATPANRTFQVSLNGSEFANGGSAYDTAIKNGSIAMVPVYGYCLNGTGDYFDSISDTAPSGGGSGNSISIVDPVDGYEQIAPINSFDVSWITATTTPDLYLDVLLANSTTTLATATATSTDVWHNPYRNYFNTALSATTTLPNYYPLEKSKTYYAKAILGSYTGGTNYTQLAESEIITFATANWIWDNDATTTQTFYAANVPAFFATTTPSIIYTSMTGFFNAVFDPILSVLQNFANLFDRDQATANGANAGASLALVFAYGQEINTIFGVPIITILIAGLLIEIAVIVWKQTHRAVKTIK